MTDHHIKLSSILFYFGFEVFVGMIFNHIVISPTLNLTLIEDFEKLTHNNYQY